MTERPLTWTVEEVALIERIAEAMRPDNCPTHQRHLSRHDRRVLAEAALRTVENIEVPL